MTFNTLCRSDSCDSPCKRSWKHLCHIERNHLINGNSTTATFKYGLTSLYGLTIPGNQAHYRQFRCTCQCGIDRALTNTTYITSFAAPNALAPMRDRPDLLYRLFCCWSRWSGNGPTNVLPGWWRLYIYTVAPIPNATGYNWTLPVEVPLLRANTNTITVTILPLQFPGMFMFTGLPSAETDPVTIAGDG